MSKVKSHLKKIFFGIRLPKEYISTFSGGISGGLNCYTGINGIQINLSENLLFLGYKPLLMGISGNREFLNLFENKQTLQIDFRRNENSEIIAQLILKKENVFSFEENGIIILSGITGFQKFESPFHQFMFRFYDRSRSKQTGNINLDPNLYNQVKIAY